MQDRSSTTAIPAKTRRRWYQFRLRTLLVLMLLASMAGGWIGLKIQHGVQRRQALEPLQELGAEVLYVDYETYWPLNKLVAPLLGSEILPEFVAVLWAENPEVNDASVALLRTVEDLDSLDLSKSAVTDEGLRHLSGLTTLRVLKLNNTQITDAGLAHLIGLSHLAELELNGTPVTDRGLEVLTRLPAIEWVELRETRVTKDGVGKLHSSKPRVWIER